MNANKKRFPITELVILVVVLAILAAVLIPTFANINKKAAETENRLNQQIAELLEKIENQESLTWEDFEEKLNEKLAALAPSGDAVTKEAVEKAIADAIAEFEATHPGQNVGLTQEQVQAIVDVAINALREDMPEGGLTKSEVKKIVKDILKDHPDNVGVSEEQMAEAISTAIEAALESTLTEEQVAAIVEKALENTLTEEQVKAIVDKAMENIATEEQMKDAINKAIQEALTGSMTEAQVKTIVDKAIKDALAGALTEAQVKTIVDNAIKAALENTVTAKQMQDAIDKAVKDALANTVTAKQMQDAIDKAVKDVLAKTLTEAQVKTIVDSAIKAALENTVTAKQMQDAIDKAVKDALANTVTAKQMQDAIDKAVKDVMAKTLTEAQVKTIVADAIKEALAKLEPCDHECLTKEEIQAIINEMLKKDVVETADADELEVAVASGKDVVLTGDVDLKYLIVPAGVDMTLDLNGKTLSVYEIEVQGDGKLLLQNGNVSVDGYVYLGNEEGVLVIENVDLKHNNNDGNCIRNYGTTFISNSVLTATSTVDGEALLVNWGTMVVNDSEIISVAKAAKPEDFAVYNSGTMTLNRVKVTANGYCVMNVDLKEDDGFTAVTNINGGTYTSKNAVIDGTFKSIYVVSNGSNSKIVMNNNVELVTPVQDAAIRNAGELVGVEDTDYRISLLK